MRTEMRLSFVKVVFLLVVLGAAWALAGCPAKGGDSEHDAGEPDAAQVVALYSVTPSSGPLAGGTSVELYGQGFEQGAVVTFGSEQAADVSVVDGARITCTTPPGPAAGPVSVRVELPDTRSAQLVGARLPREPHPRITGPEASPEAVQRPT